MYSFIFNFDYFRYFLINSIIIKVNLNHPNFAINYLFKLLAIIAIIAIYM